MCSRGWSWTLDVLWMCESWHGNQLNILPPTGVCPLDSGQRHAILLEQCGDRHVCLPVLVITCPGDAWTRDVDSEGEATLGHRGGRDLLGLGWRPGWAGVWGGLVFVLVRCWGLSGGESWGSVGSWARLVFP